MISLPDAKWFLAVVICGSALMGIYLPELFIIVRDDPKWYNYAFAIAVILVIAGGCFIWPAIHFFAPVWKKHATPSQSD